MKNNKKSECKRGALNPMWGKHFTLEQRKRISDAKKGQSIKRIGKERNYGYFGKNHWMWRGGKSFMPYSPEFNRQLKELIKTRDSYRCQECFIHQNNTGIGKGNGRALNIHHIDYNKLNCMPNNLISLCNSCHSKTNFKRENWTVYFNQALTVIALKSGINTTSHKTPVCPRGQGNKLPRASQANGRKKR